MSTKMPKRGLHEEFAGFFETPTRDTLRELLKNNLGEHSQLDFKEAWDDDNSNLGRHLLGFGNSGGGCIVFGVKQNDDQSLEAVGLSKPLDKSEIYQKAAKYLPQQLGYEVVDFAYQSSEYQRISGKTFQVIFVSDLPDHLPFVCESDGNKARKGAIYVRRKTDTVEADYEELQRILNRRIETQYSTQSELDLKKEFEELKALYGMLSRTIVSGTLPGLETFAAVVRASFQLKTELNSKYPSEDYEDFIIRMIDVKKARIEKIIAGT